MGGGRRVWSCRLALIGVSFFIVFVLFHCSFSSDRPISYSSASHLHDRLTPVAVFVLSTTPTDIYINQNIVQFLRPAKFSYFLSVSFLYSGTRFVPSSLVRTSVLLYPRRHLPISSGPPSFCLPFLSFFLDIISSTIQLNFPAGPHSSLSADLSVKRQVRGNTAYGTHMALRSHPPYFRRVETILPTKLTHFTQLTQTHKHTELPRRHSTAL